MSRRSRRTAPEFVATICTLTELVMGPELGHVLRVVYAKEGVRWAGRDDGIVENRDDTSTAGRRNCRAECPDPRSRRLRRWRPFDIRDIQHRYGRRDHHHVCGGSAVRPPR